MAFWDGEKWIPEGGVGAPTATRRGPRLAGGLAIVGVVAAVVLAAQGWTPALPKGPVGTTSSVGHAGNPSAADTRSVPPRGATGSTGLPVTGGIGATPAPAAVAAIQGTTSTNATGKIAALRPTAILQTSGTPVYLHYYLWWTKRHWQEKLGSSYPYTANPLPLPGQTDESGCSPTASFTGATIVDIPTTGLYDQGLASTFDSHIQTAIAFGITGFVADWAGTGSADQVPSSSGYNARLDLLVNRVDAWNATHTQKFRLALDFAAFGNYSRSASAIINDLRYFIGRYGGDSAFASAFSSQPLVMLIGSRKYSLATIQAVSAAARPAVFLLGDETYTSLSRNAPYLDGSSYYWSSESPSNSGAKNQIASLGSQLRAAGKPWFAPFTAGYDTSLKGGHCVPRNGVATLDTIWGWNQASNPDAWFGVSWNEYVENTYLEPSVKYGSTYLAEIARLSGN